MLKPVMESAAVSAAKTPALKIVTNAAMNAARMTAPKIVMNVAVMTVATCVIRVKIFARIKRWSFLKAISLRFVRHLYVIQMMD